MSGFCYRFLFPFIRLFNVNTFSLIIKGYLSKFINNKISFNQNALPTREGHLLFQVASPAIF